jgi:hypothetical protein
MGPPRPAPMIAPINGPIPVLKYYLRNSIRKGGGEEKKINHTSSQSGTSRIRIRTLATQRRRSVVSWIRNIVCRGRKKMALTSKIDERTIHPSIVAVITNMRYDATHAAKKLGHAQKMIVAQATIGDASSLIGRIRTLRKLSFEKVRRSKGASWRKYGFLRSLAPNTLSRFA